MGCGSSKAVSGAELPATPIPPAGSISVSLPPKTAQPLPSPAPVILPSDTNSSGTISDAAPSSLATSQKDATDGDDAQAEIAGGTPLHTAALVASNDATSPEPASAAEVPATDDSSSQQPIDTRLDAAGLASKPPSSGSEAAEQKSPASNGVVATVSEVLESVQLSPLNGTELGSRIAATVLADDLVDDDGTFRAPAQALLKLFDDDHDGLLTGDETYRMLRTFAEPMAIAMHHQREHESEGLSDAEHDPPNAEEIEEAVRILHDQLLRIAAGAGDAGIDVRVIELWLEELETSEMSACHEELHDEPNGGLTAEQQL